MNLREIFSRARREVCLKRVFLRVTTRLTVPGQVPYKAEYKSAQTKTETTRKLKTHLDQDEVVLDDTVTNETTDGGDSLLGNIELGRSRSLIVSLADTVDLLVDPVLKKVKKSQIRSKR